MDSARGRGHYLSAMAPKPLKVRKTTEPFVAGSQSQRSTHKPHVGSFLKGPNDLLQNSSSQKMDDRHRESQILIGKTTMEQVPPRSTISSFKEAYLTDAWGGPTTASATRSISDSLNLSSRSETSSIAMMGDFVPMELQTSGRKVANTEGRKVPFETKSVARKVPLIVNPYEFDPESPHLKHDRQTRFADFISSFDATPYFSPQLSYITTFQPQLCSASPRPTSLIVPMEKCGGQNLRRSDSSPSVLSQPFPAIRNTTQNSEFLSYDHTDGSLASPASKEFDPLETRGRRGPQPENVRNPGSPSRELFHTSLRNRDNRSPQRRPQQMLWAQSDDRVVTNSPTKNLGVVIERDENEATNPPWKQAVETLKKRSRSPMKKVFGEHGWMGRSPGEVQSPAKKVIEREEDDITTPSPNPSFDSPLKRSHSPMKKMFGEHGWLGNSPSEINEHKFQDKNLAEAAKSQSGRHKKTTMMGKIKTKLEEIAEKADISPMRGFRNEDKHAKISVLAISLGPPEQARILMEIELMLVHTANSFIMSQFSQGRMVVDSIKKIVDMWKSKGRPPVTEFMYDQATQRELVVANQHNFRFHGDTVVSDVRITSMLYNWKNVASLMAVRIFCVADTVLLKLVFDVEQILELLGAGQPILLRLQAIRAVVNEMMRMARQKSAKSTSTTNSRTGQDTDWRSTASTRSPHRSQTTEAGSQQDSGMPSHLFAILT